MKKVTSRQTAMIVFLSVISMKFLLMPATMSKYAGRNIYFSVFLGLFLDFLTLLVYLWVDRKYPNQTFYNILQSHFGTIFSKLVYMLLAVVFFVKGLFVVKATHSYFLDTLYDDFEWWLFVIPLIIFLYYVLKKNWQVLGRTCEICIVIIFLAIIICLILPINSFEIINVLPILNNGLGEVFEGLIRCSYGFGDYLILLLLLGNIESNGKKMSRLVYYSLVAIVLITVYFFEFVALFGDIAVNQDLAISDVSVHAQLPNTLGRIDWLIIFLWSFTLILTCAVLFFASKTCIVEVIGHKQKWLANILVVGGVVAMIFALYLNLALLIKIVTSVYYIVFSLTIYWGIPILLLLCILIDKIKQSKGKVRYENA